MLSKLSKLFYWVIDFIFSYVGFDFYRKKNIEISFERINDCINKDNLPSIPKDNVDIFFKEIFLKETDVLGGNLRNCGKKEKSKLLHALTIGFSNCFIYYKCNKKISNKYVKINWNHDAISNKSLPYIRHHFIREEIFFGRVDIKFIWEIARFHEMLTLALLINHSDDEIKSQKYIDEYISRFYDFIGSNPVGFGPNWVCAMEVGIRVINFIISISLLKNKLHDEFYLDAKEFINYSYNYICNNFENRGESTNNHYLTNLVSILFVLKFSKEMNDEYDKYSKLFINEINKQFNSDGSCFEGSTSYHCLSFELMKIGYFCLDENNKLLIYDKCRKASEFLYNIYFSDYEKHRIGDDDSGKIIKTIYDYITNDFDAELFPIEARYRDVNYNLSDLIELYHRDKYLLNDYFDNHIFNIDFLDFNMMSGNDLNTIDFDMSEFKIPEVPSYHWTLSSNIKDIFYYKDFGAILVKYKNASLFFRVGGQNSGHRHEDELHIDLYVKGNINHLDSGSVNYTLFSEIRNIYRSAKAHFVPYDSFADLTNLFQMNLKDDTKIIFSICDGFYKISASYSSYRRDIFLCNNEIKVFDYINEEIYLNGKISNLLSSSTRYGSLNSEEVINYLPSL